MRELQSEYGRGDASFGEPRDSSLHKGYGVGSVLGAGALCLSIAILWGILPVNGPRSNFAGAVPSLPKDAARNRLSAAPGFSVRLYASGLGEARQMAMTRTGDILVSSPGSKVLLVKADRNGDGAAEGVYTLIDDLHNVHGLALDGSWLYVAESESIFRIRYDAARGSVAGPKEPILRLPGGGGHWTRTIKKGPDGWFYVSVGSSCDACIEERPWRAAMIRFRAGQEPQLYASGLRDTVGFDWQPGTDDLYGVDHGRDLLGDDFPPDELNRIVQGGFYGWPYLNGANTADPVYGEHEDSRLNAAIPPAFAFAGRAGPMSIRFLQHADATAYEDAALVAQHGKSNRSRGYRVVSLHWSADGVISEKPFLTGFEKGDEVIGRPTDIVEGADGKIYVADDYAGAIWRVVRER